MTRAVTGFEPAPLDPTSNGNGNGVAPHQVDVVRANELDGPIEVTATEHAPIADVVERPNAANVTFQEIGRDAVRSRFPRSRNAAVGTGRAILSAIGGVSEAKRRMDARNARTDEQVFRGQSRLAGIALRPLTSLKYAAEGSVIAVPAVLNANTGRRADKAADKAANYKRVKDLRTATHVTHEIQEAQRIAAGDHRHRKAGDIIVHWANSALAERAKRLEAKHMGKLQGRAMKIDERRTDMAAQKQVVAEHAAVINQKVEEMRQARREEIAAAQTRKDAARTNRRGRVSA